jgi:FtsH-binding integral membrane protein
MTASGLPLPVVSAPAGERARFVRAAYAHVAGAIAAFAIVEWLLLRWPGARQLAARMTEGYNWLLVMLAFFLVSGVADRWARSEASQGRQYLGLGLAVLAQAVLFLPLLLGVAGRGDDVLPTAGLITAALVAGLTGVVVVTRTDFSFLRSALTVGGLIALGLIVASILFGVSLGLGFSLAMVAFAAGAILYNTSNVLRSYRTDQPVAAALALFGSIALLFWWVINVVGAQRR